MASRVEIQKRFRRASAEPTHVELPKFVNGYLLEHFQAEANSRMNHDSFLGMLSAARRKGNEISSNFELRKVALFDQYFSPVRHPPPGLPEDLAGNDGSRIAIHLHNQCISIDSGSEGRACVFVSCEELDERTMAISLIVYPISNSMIQESGIWRWRVSQLARYWKAVMRDMTNDFKLSGWSELPYDGWTYFDKEDYAQDLFMNLYRDLSPCMFYGYRI